MVALFADMADWGAKLATAKAAARPPHSQGDTPCFLYVWQGKDLQEGEFVCVAGKGLAGGRICMCGSERSYGWILWMCGRQKS